MQIALWIFGILAALLILWLLSMTPRRGEKQLERFRQYRYAHRGLHNKERGVPENSLLAFRYAVAGGFGAELDVHLTKDKRLVVIHDSYVDRMCGTHGRVEDMTLSQLRELRLLGTEQKIPLLEEVLPIFCGKTPLIIELKVEKNNHRQLCEKTMQVLSAYRGDYCIESFDPRALQWMRRNEPFVIRGQLAENFLEQSEVPGLQLLGRFVLTMLMCNFLTRPDFVAYRYEDRLDLPARLCCGLLKAQEVSWTIRKQADLEVVEQAGAIPIFEGFLPARRPSPAKAPQEQPAEKKPEKESA